MTRGSQKNVTIQLSWCPMVPNASRNSRKDRKEGHFTSEGISTDLGGAILVEPNYSGSEWQKVEGQ